MAKSGVLNTGVFERQGADRISGPAFYLTLTLSLLWGFLLTAFAAQKAIDSQIQFNTFTYLLVGLGIPILGIVISVNSDNPIISFLGYNLIVVPMGIVLGPALQNVRPDVITHALYMTAGVTGIMGLTGILFPSVYQNIGGALFIALCGLLILRICQMFIPAMAAMTWIDYLAAGIFALYIGYDMYRASSIQKTTDNAIDIAIQLYLDILNLFLAFLRTSDD